MAEIHRPLRAPFWLWEQYGGIAGGPGRSPDLRVFMDWQVEHPELVLGPDVPGPHDFLATLRVDSEHWKLFMATVGERNCSSRMRSYIWWRVQHPAEPLPGPQPCSDRRTEALV